LKILELDIAREGERLKLGAHEVISGQERTIRHYEEVQVSADTIQTKCRQTVDTLNKANRKGRVGREGLAKLREIGQVLHDELFSLSVKETLSNTAADYLNLKIDEQLVHIPWEILSDGRQFLCRRFNVGRLVKTRQPGLGFRSRRVTSPLRMLILADPEGDLKGAYLEGTQIRDYVDRENRSIGVSLRSGNISPDFVKEKMRNFEFVHFAGHADYNLENPADSGWRLTGGSLRARDITKMAGTGTMPALIFSNACQSARTEQWNLNAHFEDEIFGLANAFLLAGVKHYLGTFWEILDEPGSRFALEFYRYLVSRMTIGEAVRQSRLALIREYGEETIVWASYVLYGDPTTNYREQLEGQQPWAEPEPARVSPPEREVRTREEVINFAEEEVPKKKRFWWPVPIGIALLLAVMLWGYPGLLKEGTTKYERAALAHYDNGKFKEALDVCRILEEKNPELCLTHLIRGNIDLANGNLDGAKTAYQKAVQGTTGTNAQRAAAFVGLGRVASLRKQPDTALQYYRQATEAAPQNAEGYVSQALLLEGRGDYDEALDLFDKARALAPQDPVLAALADETRKKAALTGDHKKQERIERLVKELLEELKSPSKALPTDGWTSRPLTVWVMDFTLQGPCLQEGQERLLVCGITDQILRHSRARVVERALLDRLLEEMKLGTSDLIDRSTALSLGRMLAARIILSGHLVYSGPYAQVSLRVIETETGRITAAVNESFGSTVPGSLLAERLSENLLAKLRELYPLRGRVLEVRDDAVMLNIGEMAGVTPGQRFKGVDQDVTLVVTSIERETSLAKTLTGIQPLGKASRVEEM